jgi:hypothetical protein
MNLSEEAKSHSEEFDIFGWITKVTREQPEGEEFLDELRGMVDSDPEFEIFMRNKFAEMEDKGLLQWVPDDITYVATDKMYAERMASFATSQVYQEIMNAYEAGDWSPKITKAIGLSVHFMGGDDTEVTDKHIAEMFKSAMEDLNTLRGKDGGTDQT